MRFLCTRSTDGTTLIDSIETLQQVFDHFKNQADVARGIITLLKSMSNYGINRLISGFFIFFFVEIILDDAIDEMISTKIDESLLYQIKRFHSDNDVRIDY